MQQRAHGTDVQLIVIDDKDLTLLIRVENLNDWTQKRLCLKTYHLISGGGVMILNLGLVKAVPISLTHVKRLTTIGPQEPLAGWLALIFGLFLVCNFCYFCHCITKLTSCWLPSLGPDVD